MNNIFTKVATTATVGFALSTAIAFGTNTPASAAKYQFSWQGNTGYSARGEFSFDQTTAPSIISESGLGTTNTLKSLSMAFFDPANTLLASYQPVVNGTSIYSYLEFNFNRANRKIFNALDLGKDDYQVGDMFLTNVYDGNGFIPASETTYLFRNLAPVIVGEDPDEVLLDFSSNDFQVTQVPEPGAIAGLLVFGAGLAYVRGSSEQA